MLSQMQKDYDKAFGFNSFPYTHGDEVERTQQEMTRQWRAELVEELEKKGAISRSAVDSQISSPSRVAGQSEMDPELEEKARNLEEAKANEHMVNL